jgi:digeranylgeranylglycerophospholipid reductase
VAADGTESQTARWAGLKTSPPLADYYIGIEYLLGGLGGRIDPQGCEYHLDMKMAPGGYLWVFPKGVDRANVGLVISADHARRVRAVDCLEQFVKKRYPGASVLSVIAGGIPVTGALKQMAMDGLIVVGDAAHQADPLTAGGICLGMIGADMAMQVGVPAVKAGDVSLKLLNEYNRLWQKRFGKMHATLYKVRKMIGSWEQEKMDGMVKTAASLPVESMSLGRIMLAILKSHPLLLLEARKLINTGLILK